MTELERALRSVDNINILVSELEQELYTAKMTKARRLTKLQEICPHTKIADVVGINVCYYCGKNIT